jgi:hypothetical protein
MNSRDWKFDKVRCPNCGEPIAVSETLSQQIASRLREEMEGELKTKENALTEKAAGLKQRELEIDKVVGQRLAEAKIAIEQQAAQKAKADQLTEFEDLKRQTQEAKNKLDQARKMELELRAKQRELEETDRLRELEVARKIDTERAKIQVAAATAADEKHRLKEAGIQKQLQDALRVNDDLKRKLEQGSQQTQGEVLELDLEQSLSAAFPLDRITPVPKGFNGADIMQEVVSNSGSVCGLIIWETKRTKTFSDAWIPKLKEDQRRAKADIAVLVSEALPKDCNNFQEIKGVWVSNTVCAVNLAAALRLVMTQVAQAKNALVGKNEKMEVLYHFLSGAEFRQRIEAIVEAFVQMQQDLNEEKRATERRWAKREKQIQRVISNTSGMYGDLQGLIGASLHDIPLLTDGAQTTDQN